MRSKPIAYQVQWRYRSTMGGPWEAGDIVLLEAPLAATINRDSPGVLLPVTAAVPDAPPNDRMVATSRRRKEP